MTDKERDRLLVLLEQFQKDAEYQYQQCQQLADLVVVLLEELIRRRGHTLQEACHHACLCGTLQASLACYLHLAFDAPSCVLALLLERAADILPALGRRLQSLEES